MRSFLELFSVIVIGLGLGGVIAQLSIQNSNGFAALKVGQWTSWPMEGSVEADPYSKAKVAAEGEVPLGAAEGLAFHSKTDSRDEPLLRECQYSVRGQTPPARLWTLSAHALNGETLLLDNGLSSNIVSRNVVRQTDGHFELQSGPNVTPENWLETNGSGPYELILRLYDSPLTSTSGIVDPQMPKITLLGCTQ